MINGKILLKIQSQVLHSKNQVARIRIARTQPCQPAAAGPDGPDVTAAKTFYRDSRRIESLRIERYGSSALRREGDCNDPGNREMKPMKLIAVFGIAVLLAACAGGQDYANKVVQISDLQDRPSQVVDTYRIGIGDSLRIDVWKNPDLSVSVPVRPDGKISAPLVGDILVAGSTPEVVASDMELLLRRYIKTPKVTVIMTSLGSTQYLTRVRVTGAVNRNVSLQHQQGMTVLDAVLEAGGPNEFADASDTRVFRRMGEETVLIPIDLDSILERGNLRDNIILQPGDTITVPERSF